MPETDQAAPAFSPDITSMLITPDPAYWPVGELDPLSAQIYRPMLESATADTMVDFIDTAGTQVDLEEVDDELNQLKLDRVLALLVRMPAALPAGERLKAWEHLLGQDWVHHCAGPFSIEHSIDALTQQDPSFAKSVKQIVPEVLARKQAELVGQDPENSLASVSPETFDAVAVEHSQTAGLLGNAVARLAMADQYNRIHSA